MTLWTTAHEASLSFTTSQSLLKLISIESVMPSNHFVLCHSLSPCPQSFPALRFFPNEFALSIRSPKYWSFNISPSNEHSELTSLELTDLTSLQSRRLSRIFSNTIVWKHQFFSTQPSLWSNSHIHTWLLENHSFQWWGFSNLNSELALSCDNFSFSTLPRQNVLPQKWAFLWANVSFSVSEYHVDGSPYLWLV